MKHTKIILASILALTLTACADTKTAEETTLLLETTSETVMAEETSSKTEDTETTAAPETEAETEKASETEAAVKAEIDGSEIMTLKASESTKYYECRFTDENVVTDPEKFEDKALLENVRKLLEESEFYKDIHSQMDQEAESWGYAQSGEYNFECRLTGAVTSDFNGDGQKESAFLFALIPNCDEVIQFVDGGMTSCLVFADSSGNISLLDEKFSHLSELNELKYNGFSHLVVNGGHNNMSSKSCVYSVNDSGLKLEFFDGKISDFSTCIIDKFLLKMTMPQWHNWLVCWNDDIKAYVTVDAVYPDKDESDKIIGNIAYDGDMTAVSVIGGKYYTVCSPAESDEPTYYEEYLNAELRTLPYFSITYELNDGTYTKLNDSDGYSICLGVRPMIDLAYLENFDFNNAVGNIIPIE